MTRLSAAVVLMCIVLGFSALQASEAMKAIVGSYLEIQALLAADKIDGVKASAAKLGATAGTLGDGGAAMVKAAKAVGDAADLKAARDAFGGLSDAVIAAAKADGWKDVGDVKIGFCPMVRRSWIQKEDKIRNPYYGTSMLECGELKKP